MQNTNMPGMVPDYGEPKKRRRRRRLSEVELGQFLQEYGRKAQAGSEPNDRGYSRAVEKKIKQLRPEQLDDLMRGEGDGDGK